MNLGISEILFSLMFSVLPAVILAVVIVFGVRWAVANGLRDAARDEKTYVKIRGTARDILDRRYADGEISREDYLRIKGDIERNTGRNDA